MQKKYFSEIVANHALLNRLSSEIEHSTLSHAYILEGAHGSGRHTVAKNLAAALSCTGTEGTCPCGRCKNCEKILGGNSPDIITIGLEGDKASIGVDAIRFLKSDIYIAPNDTDVKMYIIENADLMTPAAQNAFLLSLEEPPEYVIFILLCENSSALLETVKSRAPILHTEKVSTEEMRRYLLQKEKRYTDDLLKSSPEDLEEILFISDGSIGYAKELLQNKKMRDHVIKNRNTAKNFIRSAATRRRGTELLSEIYAITGKSKQRSDSVDLLINIQYALRDLILLQKSESATLCFYRNREDAEEIAGITSSERLFAMYDSVVLTLNDISKNANVRLSLLDMLFKAKIV